MTSRVIGGGKREKSTKGSLYDNWFGYRKHSNTSRSIKHALHDTRDSSDLNEAYGVPERTTAWIQFSHDCESLF